MKKLIINADDLGYSSSVNEAVRRLYENDAISGTSLMACGKAFSEGASMVSNSGRKDVGAHLTLTGALEPASDSISKVYSLVDEKGVFLKTYSKLFLKLASGKIRKDHIYKEFMAQVEAIKNAGLNVTHIDSHEHVHMFPGILDVVLDVAKESGVEYIRFPFEDGDVVYESFSVKDMIRHSALKLFSMPVRGKFREFKHNTFFMGHYHAGRIDTEVLQFMAKNIKEGVTELAVHPCAEDDLFLKSAEWYKNGPKELEALMEAKEQGLWRKSGIDVVAHPAI